MKVEKKSEKLKIKVFCDFDGTIAYDDVGNEFFKEFGKFEPSHSKLISGYLSISDYYFEVCQSLRKDITDDEIAGFIADKQIDPYFRKFLNFCRKNEIEVFVISDGFDFYINPLFILNDLSCTEIACNNLIRENDGSFYPVFPLAAESCNCRCASCKRNAMMMQVEEETVSVFIGDGISDYCVAEHADIVFAKKELAAYCNLKKIPHYPYSNFFDVCRLLNTIIIKNKIKKRHQAELLRKKAFETE